VKEKTLDEFFTTIKARIRRIDAKPRVPNGTDQLSGPEQALLDEYRDAEYRFKVELCDSFSTQRALEVLLNLVSEVNIYLAAKHRLTQPVRDIAKWVTEMLRMFGLGEGTAAAEIGWGKRGETPASVAAEEQLGDSIQAMVDFREDVRKIANAKGSSEDYIELCDRSESAASGESTAQSAKYIQAMVSFRDDVRQIATAGGTTDSLKRQIFELSDRFRDEDLVELGVQLDDGRGEEGEAMYSLVDPVELKREKAAIAEAKEAKKAAEEAKRIAKLEKGRTPPTEMFRPPHVENGVWSEWDGQGIPQKDGEGNQISKGALKKAQKAWEAQAKAHKEFLAWQAEGDK